MEVAATVERTAQVRRGLQLEYLTLGYNSLEAVIAILAGLIAGSIALVGFGADSVIEVVSGLSLVWRLRSDANVARRARAEAISLRIVGVCFAALAGYVAWDAAVALVRRETPEESVPGIILAAASIVIMPLLARAKRRVAGHIASAALTADARQTQLCAYLSAILLGGLLLNALFGWWWADPVAALAMVPIIGKEGADALRGKTCCASCH
ncbi:MAG TPA: cation transporter [Bryobacteraceae bacterium]|nr:cation transporter [Bryobacteraceae bacterium]